MASEEEKRRARLKAGAPLVKGVQGKQQALMNMDARGREVAQLKSQTRANRPDRKGKPGGNLVNRYNDVVTGSTSKSKRFDTSSKGPSEARLNALRMLKENAAKGNKRSKDKLNRPRFSMGNSGMRGGSFSINDLNK